MHPVLSKLTMCVCAAGSGAAVIPAAHVVKRHFAPHHAAHRPAAPIVAVSAPRDCLPGATLTAGGAGAPMAPLSLDSGQSLASPATDSFPFGPSGLSSGFHPTSGSPGGPVYGGGGGFEGGGGYGGGPGPGGGSGPGGGPGGGGGTGSTPGGPPVASNAPEPASWALMVTGFAVLGGAMRLARPRTPASVGEGDVVEVQFG